MSNASDGMNYAPKGKSEPVVKPGEFVFAATHFDHGHIYGMCNGLTEAGGELGWVFDEDPERLNQICKTFPNARRAESLEQILDNPEVKLVAAAAIPNLRGPLGLKVMDAGKDYFTDKTPFTTMQQLEDARAKAAETGCKYMVYYSERLHSESGMFAGQLIEEGVIGRVLQVIGLGPHRIGKPGSRPDWFYKKEQYGGILCDIGSHQCEQFLHYSGAKDATINSARVENFAHPEFPELEDFGEACLIGDNGASFYYRVDWFTPDGLRTWGDGRTIILGTDGFMELRKHVDLATEEGPDQLLLANGEGEKRFSLQGKVGYKFFGQLILDVLNRTENAMTQAHAFKTAELCLRCQEIADKNRG